jgi:hypothetical protein
MNLFLQDLIDYVIHNLIQSNENVRQNQIMFKIDVMSSKKSKKGGSRPGAGAKIKGDEARSVTVSARLTPSHVAKLDLISPKNRSEALSKCIEAFQMNAEDRENS